MSKRVAGAAWLVVMAAAMTDTMLLGDLLLPLAGWVAVQAGFAGVYLLAAVGRRDRVCLERAGHLGVMALLTAAMGSTAATSAMAGMPGMADMSGMTGMAGMSGMSHPVSTSGSFLVSMGIAVAVAYLIYAGVRALRCRGLALVEHLGCALAVVGMAAMLVV